MRITVDILNEHKACNEQLTAFKKEWPDGVEVSRAALIRALELVLEVYWVADKLLSPEALTVFEDEDLKAWNIYRDATLDFRKARNAVFDAGFNPAARKKAGETYNAAIAEPRRILFEARADAFMAALAVHETPVESKGLK
jgi:hypothetical protein